MVGGDKYQAAIQNPAKAFKDPELQRGSIERKNGLPFARSGGFAMVYRLSSRDTDGRRERLLAVRCFKNLPEDLADRYRAICAEVSSLAAKSDLFVSTRFIPDGIRIGQDWKPITTMTWVEGEFLDHYFDTWHDSKPRMGVLANRIAALADDLQRYGVAHGDLHRGNILVTGQDADPRLALIDYDAMFVPALRGRHSNEGGHPDYQHPGRDAGHFSATLDRFAIIVMLLSVIAVNRHAELWDPETRSGEGLLTGQADYASPNGSPVLAKMESFDDLAPAVRLFRRICLGTFEEIPSHREFLAELVLDRPSNVQTADVPRMEETLSPVERPSIAPLIPRGPILQMDDGIGVAPPGVAVSRPVFGGRRQGGASLVPMIAATKHQLEQSLGDRVEVIGQYARFEKGDGDASPYRTLVVTHGPGETFEIRVDRDVARHFADMKRRWVVKPGIRLATTGLLLATGGRFYIDLESPALLRILPRKPPGPTGASARLSPSPTPPPTPAPAQLPAPDRTKRPWASRGSSTTFRDIQQDIDSLRKERRG